ncbi:gastrula zinc finger protein XLCGF46.1 [Culex quinquefasciatus]|uniref:Gastrula zinc finger protein XLCGF46.1 n=1 Tax=Culex quinquefasciatus TaxID=7176 RepID=B0W5E9_CULQU|nr:gastrula zinc finger protein XLCGF46.1 [Culex quinquefasciatus]|eukprot:XP_001843937.1 gastrula zinc finger protein XLCGF46.1 [Culex quinquefasciatus]
MYETLIRPVVIYGHEKWKMLDPQALEVFKRRMLGKIFDGVRENNEIIEHNKIHHKNRPHICEHCGETFSRNQQYQVHVQGHFINKMKMQEQNSKKTYKYSCRSCGIVFNNQKYLEKHVQKTGHQAEGVICETCGAVFSSNIKLHQHVARTHKNEKRFTCEHCSKVFNQKANLDRHLLLHTNISEKSYPCEQCSASYLSMASLREHIKVAHIGALNLPMYSEKMPHSSAEL